MNHLYHFRILPWQMERFMPREIDALEAALTKIKKDSAGG